MNDRFKFRVWDNINKRYEKDLTLLDKDGDLCYQDGHKYCNGEHPEDFTIEQCTGLKDKSGKPIYEGDILCHFDYGKREVFYSIDTASFMLRSLQPIPVEGMEDIFMTWFFCREIISEYYIIGNIHEKEGFRPVCCTSGIKPDWLPVVEFDASNWQKSRIKRPDKKTLPDLCKTGGWVYNRPYGYRKILGCENGNIFFSGELKLPIEGIADFVTARIRPYNAEEMKALMGKVIEKGPSMHIVTGFENVLDNECMVHVNGCLYSANDLLRQFTIDNAPCGVLEHIENGAWME